MSSVRDRLRYADNYCVLARHQVDNGQLQEALASLQAALRLAPHHLPAMQAQARLLCRLDLAEEARAHLQRWQALDGSNPECHLLLGNVALSGRQFATALDHYAQAQSLGDHSACIEYNMGLAYYFLDELPAAEGSFRRALELEPRLAAATDGLGLLARQRGQAEAAAALFRQAYATDPTLVEALDHLVQVYLELGRLQPAQEMLEVGLQQTPEWPRLWHLLGVVYAAQDDHLRAVRAFKQALALHPQQAETDRRLAVSLRSLGQWAEAMVALDRALQAEGETAQVLLERGRTLAACGRTQAALDDLLRAWELEPGNAEVAAALDTIRRTVREV